jgi:hypothetical protein
VSGRRRPRCGFRAFRQIFPAPRPGTLLAHLPDTARSVGVRAHLHNRHASVFLEASICLGDLPRRSFGAYRRQLQLGPRTYTILLKGREGRARRALSGSSPRDQPGKRHVGLDGTSTREPALGLSATLISTEQRDRASADGQHSRRSNHGPLTRICRRSSAISCPTCSCARRRKRWWTVSRRRRRTCRVVAHRRRPRVAWPRHLPAISDRAWRAADHRLLAGAGGAAARIDRPHGSIVCTDHGAVLALDPNEARGLASRIARAGDSRGTACASLHSGAPASPLATVRAGAAAHRVLLRNEGSSHVRVTPVTVLE